MFAFPLSFDACLRNIELYLHSAFIVTDLCLRALDCCEEEGRAAKTSKEHYAEIRVFIDYTAHIICNMCTHNTHHDLRQFTFYFCFLSGTEKNDVV